jgi:hypothetical protein
VQPVPLALRTPVKSPDPFMFIPVPLFCKGSTRGRSRGVQIPDHTLATFLADMLNFTITFPDQLPAMVQRATHGTIERLEKVVHQAPPFLEGELLLF